MNTMESNVAGGSNTNTNNISRNEQEAYSLEGYYAPTKFRASMKDINDKDDKVYVTGNQVVNKTSNILPTTSTFTTQQIVGSAMENAPDMYYTLFDPNDDVGLDPTERESVNEFKNRTRKAFPSTVDTKTVYRAKFKTAWQDPDKRNEMLNEVKSDIQNGRSFPYYIKKSEGLLAAKYDYQIIPGDPRYSSMITLENKLRDARAALGIQVHGSNNIARAVKYYMYNRFKTPDLNMAQNKMTTHIFFTRPDLNVLVKSGNKYIAHSQVRNHTDAAMIWRRYPELFKLLTDYKRCGDDNNFNFLLSQQITNLDIQDENLEVIQSGKSWNGYDMSYGTTFSGRTGGEFTSYFTETNDMSVLNLIRLWMIYIANVANGAWSPSYNLGLGGGIESWQNSHVHMKELDYAASAYVFKCGPDGEDVLYWTKYYGIFPVSTGEGALSWDIANNIGDTPKLSIRFRYCYKRSMSPISLIEFNDAANIAQNASTIAYAENSYNANFNHSARPYVGAPFIDMKLSNPRLTSNGVTYDGETSHIRLKFKKASDTRLSDNLLYRSSYAQENIYNKEIV